ncbi:MAG: protein phosphatase CheZ [Porticoccaceae bacterium]
MIADETLALVRDLLREAEQGNHEQAEIYLDELSRVKQTELFREVGKLTRDLHDALNHFRMDTRLADFAVQEIPDAKERLNYVITMTEQSANKTLGAVESALPVSEQLRDRSFALIEDWRRFRRRDMSAQHFREFCRELDIFFVEVSDGAKTLNGFLSEVLMAQDFQDLTGQIIRRVITLVQDLELSLVDLIRLSGPVVKASSESGPKAGKVVALAGPIVPGVDHGDSVQGQDEVDSLLSSLGF